LEPNCPPRGTVFFAHGMAGYKEQSPIQAVAKAAIYEGFTVVLADFTHGFGDADGSLEGLTMTSHAEDFEDVCVHILAQNWFKEPFIIGGHSIGNLAALNYIKTPENQQKVDGLIAVSPNLSGQLRLDAFEKYQPQALVRFKERGYLNIKDPESGKHGKLMRDYISDFMSYDMLKCADAFEKPVLFITGLDDVITPPEGVRAFLSKALNCHLTYHEIYGEDHFWRTNAAKGTLSLHVEEWLEKLFS